MIPHLQMLEVITAGLGELLPACVFVGGITTVLYTDAPGAAEPRPTDDVDCVIEIASLGEYQQLEEQLRGLGFEHDRRPKAPVCRWIYRGVTVDVMPTNERILGFSNRWYCEGMKQTRQHTLPSGAAIQTFSLPYFLATKFEAYASRGQNDPRLSSDVEDIFYVLDGVTDPMSDIVSAPADVKNFLALTVATLSKQRDFKDAVEIHLSREGSERIARAWRILQQIEALAHHK